MNKYSSIERTVWARNLSRDELETDDSVKQPVVIPDNAAMQKFTMLDIDQNSISPHSNLVVRRAGLFSNFADGLVWHPQCRRMYLGFYAYSFRDDPTVGDLTGAVSIAQCSSTLNGAGTSFDTELAIGDFIAVGSYINQVIGVTSAVQAQLLSQPPQDYVGVTATKLQVLGTDTLRRIEIGLLNYMHSVDEYLSLAALSTNATKLGVKMELFNTDDVIFLTHSIDSAFFDKLYDVSFDAGVDIEYTGRG